MVNSSLAASPASPGSSPSLRRKNTFFYRHVIGDMVLDMQPFPLLPDQQRHVFGAVSPVGSQLEYEPSNTRPTLWHPDQVTATSSRMVQDEDYPCSTISRFSCMPCDGKDSFMLYSMGSYFTVPLLYCSFQRTDKSPPIDLTDRVTSGRR